MVTDGFALITPAKNEERYIADTILSVVSQTVRPLRWVIVDDGSQDSTASIARTYTQRHSWIVLVTLAPKAARTFASKAFAFGVGLDYLQNVDYQYIGNLDADIRLSPTYYEKMIAAMKSNRRIGIVGGRVFDVDRSGHRCSSKNSHDSVRGAVQFFRRECYTDIGGYRPLRCGGIDSAAEIAARTNGWEVRTYAGVVATHLRPTGINTTKSPLVFHFRRGIKDHLMGYIGPFEIARCLGRMKDRPYGIGGFIRLAGYCHSRLRGDVFVLPIDIVRRFRQEQRRKLRLAMGGRRLFEAEKSAE